MSDQALEPADLADLVGQEIGVSSWHLVDQARIDAFAACTEDHQWIHVDVERAARESPFGGTVAHGFLTLSLLAPTSFELLMSRIRVRQAVNYGLDTVRFIAPVRAGKRVRNHIRLLAVEEKGGQAGPGGAGPGDDPVRGLRQGCFSAGRRCASLGGP